MDALIQDQASHLGPDQQESDQQGPCERSLKCKDHFDITGATDPNQNVFCRLVPSGILKVLGHLCIRSGAELKPSVKAQMEQRDREIDS